MKKSLRLLAAVTCIVGVTAHAGDEFERKPGLWKTTTQLAGESAPHLAEQCLAADTDARIARLSSDTMKGVCSQFEAHKVGATYVVDSICTIGSRVAHGHQVTTLNGDSAYHVVVKTHYDNPPAHLPADSVMTLDGRWAGACPANMKPGDLVMQVGPQMPGGMKTNVLETLSK